MADSCCGGYSNSEANKVAMTADLKPTEAVAQQPTASSEKSECCYDMPAKGQKSGCCR